MRARSSETRVSLALISYRQVLSENIPLSFITIIDTKQTRIVKRTVPVESFFNFFTPPNPPNSEDGSEGGEGADDLEERLELDYTLGEDIKEKLIPRAVDWYTGEALQFEELDDLEEGDFDEDDEDDEDVSDEDRDDDEEDSDDEV